MELLLFLSAILSALTGVVTGTRAPEQQQVASRVVAAAQVAQAPAAQVLAQRPVNSVNFAEPAPFVALALHAAAPLYAERLRE